MNAVYYIQAWRRMKVISYKPGKSKKQVYWGLPGWLDELGEIKEGKDFRTNEEMELFE